MVMGKANVSKKKQWRRLPSAVPVVQPEGETEVKGTSTLPEDQLFVLDKSGDRHRLNPYPTQFARPKSTPPSSKSKSPLSKPVSKKSSSNSDLFDLWSSPPSSKPTNPPPLSHIPAVIPPLPGQSYNPSATALKDTWSKVLTEEVKKDYEKEAYKQAVQGYQVVEKDTEIVSEEETNEDRYCKNPPTLNKKPNKAKINKRLRWLLKEKEEEEEKSRKEMQKQIDAIPKILEEQQKTQQKREIEREKQLKRQREEKLAEAKGLKAPKIRMGQFVYELPDTEAKYTEEPVPLRLVQAKNNSSSNNKFQLKI